MPKVTPAIERFWKFVEKTDDGCWIWQGARLPNGYPRFHDGASGYAHRFSHEHFVGPIPDGWTIDHLCRTPACVRPDHLEAVTHRVNVLRSFNPCANKARQELCINGHEFDRVNKHGHRICDTCARARAQKARDDAKRAAA